MATMAMFAQTRADFVRRTYNHLGGAILAFVGFEALLLQWPGAEALAMTMIDGWMWLLVLGAFMLVATVAQKWAESGASPSVQYAGLALFVGAEAVVFLPLMYLATIYSSPDVIPTAGVLTAVMVFALSMVARVKDFSFLCGFLQVTGLIALGVIVISILMGFSLGLVFAAAMTLYASGAVLYETSNIMRHYRTDQHVAASLCLFASVALLFWYVLQIVMNFDLSDD